MSDIEQCFKKYQPTTSINYIDINLPFNINPNQFIEWLKTMDNEPLTGNYNIDVTRMCKFACYYILLEAKKYNFNLKRLKHCSGYYGIANHDWMLLDNKYIIDLTLQQFEINAPKLAIIDIQNEQGKYKAISQVTC